MNLFKCTRIIPESYTGVKSDCIPGQSTDLKDLFTRFTNGQRLLVNQRPVNVYPMDDNGNFVDPSVYDENMENVLPDIEDRVDLEEYVSELKERRNSLRSSKKSKEEKSKEEKLKEEKPKEEKTKEETT